MIRIDILSVVPDLLRSPLEFSILKRARQKGLLEVNVYNIRDWATGKHRKVDDYAFGGGAGMVLMAEPIARAIRELSDASAYDEVVFMTPDGAPLLQPVVNEMSMKSHILILTGHYKGVDQRVRDTFVTREISIGDYVLSGGELPALVLTDAIARVIPGVLSDETSALTDSFQDGLLGPPVYTRPSVWEGMAVPEVLLSGNFRAIDQWRDEQALEKTRIRRPDLLERRKS